MAGGLQDREALARLANAPKELQRDLERSYRAAGRHAAGRAQDAIRAAASRHDGTLRAEIAHSVSVTLRRRGSGLTVQVTAGGSRMPSGKSTLAAYADGSRSRWRHPVYGNEDVWVSQEWPSARGWFTRTLRGEADSFTAAARDAMGQLAAYLDRG